MHIRRPPVPDLWPGCLFAIMTGWLLLAPGPVSGADRAGGGGAEEPRLRARELGIVIGRYQPGPLNAITDVAGVKVGHLTLIRGQGALKPGEGPVRTGVTVVIPREDVWRKKVPAGAFVLNGTGEMSGLAWVAESGFLEYPIALTSTLNIPRVANGVMNWMFARYPDIGIRDDTLTPVVAECDDSRLNDSQGRHVSEQDVVTALDSASGGPVAEGSVGAGTGMVSYGFKGGIGTSSRRLSDEDGGYTVGVLVNANHGRREELTVGGIPVGQVYGKDTGSPLAGGPGSRLRDGSHRHTPDDGCGQLAFWPDARLCFPRSGSEGHGHRLRTACKGDHGGLSDRRRLEAVHGN